MGTSDQKQSEITGNENTVIQADNSRINIKHETTIYPPPAPKPDRLATLLAWLERHWALGLGVLVSGGLIALVFPVLRDRYLLPDWGGWAVWAAVLLLMMAAAAIWPRPWPRLPKLGAGVGASLPLLAVLGYLAWPVLHPTYPAAETYNIAVALFGEGAQFAVTAESREITAVVLQNLQRATANNPAWAQVRVVPVGLVTSEAEARAEGAKHHADVVIWGQVQVVGARQLSMMFQILETPDRMAQPNFPVVLPTTPDTRFFSGDVPVELADIKTFAQQQSVFVTGFSLGLAAYFNRDYLTATQQLDTAAQALVALDPARSATLSPTLGLTYFYWGRSHQRLGQLDTGETWLAEAARLAPTDPGITLSRAYGQNSLGNRQTAETLANQAVTQATAWLATHPNDAAALYDMGLAHLLLNKPSLAAQEFTAAIEAQDNFYMAYLTAGQAHQAAGDTAKAIEMLKKAKTQAEATGRNPAWAYLYLAEVYLETKDLTNAEQFYKDAVDAAPEVDWLHYRLGQFYEEVLKQPDAAEAAYREVLATTTDKAWGHAVLGGFLKRQERRVEAIDHYKQAVDLRPQDVLTRVYLAELYAETGQSKDREEAEKLYAAVLAETQARPMSYVLVSYGKTLVLWGKYELAIVQFELALDLDPHDGVALFNSGRAYEALEDWATARAIYAGLVAAPQDYSPEIVAAAQDRLRELNANATTTATLLPPPALTATRPVKPHPTPTATPTLFAQVTPTATPPPSANTATPPPTKTRYPTKTPYPTETPTLPAPLTPFSSATLPAPDTPEPTTTPPPNPTFANN